MKKSILTKALAVTVILAVFAGFYALAASVGSNSDPLVSLSYIDEVVTPELEDYIDDAVEDKGRDIQNRLDDRLDELMDEIYYN